jgi:hypothetical protein
VSGISVAPLHTGAVKVPLMVPSAPLVEKVMLYMPSTEVTVVSTDALVVKLPALAWL